MTAENSVTSNYGYCAFVWFGGFLTHFPAFVWFRSIALHVDKMLFNRGQMQ